ncbi:MAG: HTH domain-containing protein [Clostridia bacterium]|nr:HTH domain-containing protein [Clostridia bacterium]
MGTAERRTEIMRVLCRRRHETISNLAEEFGVSTRTILRDIEVLSVMEPIYTQCGRYGGVFVTDDYSMSRMYMTDKELSVLHKLSKFADEKAVCNLSMEENNLLKFIISQYTKQKN